MISARQTSSKPTSKTQLIKRVRSNEVPIKILYNAYQKLELSVAAMMIEQKTDRKSGNVDLSKPQKGISELEAVTTRDPEQP